MGCERTPFIIVMMSSLLLVVQGSFQVKIIGVIFFVVMTGIMAFLTRKDSYFFKILFRYLCYQDYYPSSAMWPGKKDCPKNIDK
jgi:type IV secretory pathway TrbD component